jgi:hypothetical protein
LSVLPPDEPPAEREPDLVDLAKVAPGVARIAAGAAVRTAEWGARAYLRTGQRLLRAAVRGESINDLVGEAQEALREGGRQLLGVGDGDQHHHHHHRTTVERQLPGDVDGDGRPDTAMDLQLRGRELLRRSADVHFTEDAHPAYARILDELSPDEARILRFLHGAGPQPSVDVRTGVGPIDIASHLIAPGLNMIGAHAGVRHMDRVPAYLNNLFRLGLIWFSREPVSDPLRYQVLEAQPEVVDALKRAGRVKKTVRRSIALTPFGADFCRLCLPAPPVPPVGL